MATPNLDYISQGLIYPQWWSWDKFRDKECLVACPGRCLWDDLKDLNHSGMDVLCVKDAIIHFPGAIQHGYCHRADHCEVMLKARSMRGISTRKQGNPVMGHSSGQTRAQGIHGWNLPGRGGSGLGGVLVALALGYKHVHVIGNPLDDSGHYYDPPWVKSPYTGGVKHWKNAERIFNGRVSCVSR